MYGRGVGGRYRGMDLPASWPRCQRKGLWFSFSFLFLLLDLLVPLKNARVLGAASKQCQEKSGSSQECGVLTLPLLSLLSRSGCLGFCAASNPPRAFPQVFLLVHVVVCHHFVFIILIFFILILIIFVVGMFCRPPVVTLVKNIGDHVQVFEFSWTLY